MFTFIHAILLGLVEGITEFLPISSTGHMILTTELLNITSTDFIKSFEIFIQLGAILAVLVLYWKKLLRNTQIAKRIFVAFIPTAIIGLLLYTVVKKYLLGNASVVVLALLIGGIALIVFEFVYKKKANELQTTNDLESISYKQAFLIGLFQSIAVVPGVSRSAATIVGGLVAGISRFAIVEFSFLLAVPTMAAAVGLDLLKTGFSFTPYEVSLLAVGFITAFVSALVAIRFLLRYIKHHTFVHFGIYRIAIGIIFLLYLI